MRYAGTDHPTDRSEWRHAQSSYFFGDAAGCPTAEPASNGSCNNGWKQADVYYVSYGSRTSFPVPQIYRTDGVQATQWWAISLYGAKYQGSKARFRSSLTQYQACQQRQNCPPSTQNPPDQGWRQLWDAVNHDSRTLMGIPWSTDVQWLD